MGDQIVLKRGNDERAVAVDPSDPKASYAAARTVIDEWEKSPSPSTAEEEAAQHESRVAAAQEQLDQASAARDRFHSEASSSTLPSGKYFNTATNAPKGAKQMTTGNQGKGAKGAAAKSTAKKSATKSTAKPAAKKGKGR